MSTKGDNWMYMIIMFDLPTKSKLQQKSANNFRIFLKKQGFSMLQLSVYARFLKGADNQEKLLNIIQNNLPKWGMVRSLTITNNQYLKMQNLVGKLTPTEQALGGQQLTLEL